MFVYENRVYFKLYFNEFFKFWIDIHRFCIKLSSKWTPVCFPGKNFYSNYLRESMQCLQCHEGCLNYQIKNLIFSKTAEISRDFFLGIYIIIVSKISKFAPGLRKGPTKTCWSIAVGTSDNGDDALWNGLLKNMRFFWRGIPFICNFLDVYSPDPQSKMYSLCPWLLTKEFSEFFR